MKVEIRIPRDPNKPRTVTVNGVLGPTCKDLTENLEKALGDVQSDTQTEEFYMEPNQQDQDLTQGNE